MKSLIVAFALLAFAAEAKVDPTGPLPMTAPCTYIRHDEMVARLKAQFGALPWGGKASTDRRKVEYYYNPQTCLWWSTVVQRSQSLTGFQVKPGDDTCIYADSEVVCIPKEE